MIAGEIKFKELIDNLKVGVFRCTPGLKGKFLFVNAAFRQMARSAQEETPGEPTAENGGEDSLPEEEIKNFLNPLENTRVTLYYLVEATQEKKTIEVISQEYFKQSVFMVHVQIPGIYCLQIQTFNRKTSEDMFVYLSWIEKHWQDGIDEVSAADRLEKFRMEDKRCKDLSFTTICGFADHGAIVHYHALPETCHTITDKDMLLVDSGGQYFEGTTDITRTIHLGTPTAEQKKHYTLVLKGHLALRHTPFPDGACGEHVNAIARMPLWIEGMDFGHGTGHGVGCYLCVHEGPQRIAYGATGVPLKPGMVVSNEPGLYFDGKYGIRIENLCDIVEKISVRQSLTGNGPFYGLADLTVVPYARKLIDVNLLTPQEIKWIDDYHQKIYDLLVNDLPQDVREWLKAETKPL